MNPIGTSFSELGLFSSMLFSVASIFAAGAGNVGTGFWQTEHDAQKLDFGDSTRHFIAFLLGLRSKKPGVTLLEIVRVLLDGFVTEFLVFVVVFQSSIYQTS